MFSSRKEDAVTDAPPDVSPGSNPGVTRRISAKEILGPKGLVQIEHEGEIYTLRLTRNNRLILTK